MYQFKILLSSTIIILSNLFFISKLYALGINDLKIQKLQNFEYAWGMDLIDNENLLVSEKKGVLYIYNFSTGKIVGKETYNDVLSKRQGELLFKMCCRYYDQVSVDLIKKLDLKKPESVRDDTDRKIKLLLTVKFDAPRKSGKRIYDDKKFVHSIEDQIKLDKRLSAQKGIKVEFIIIIHYVNSQ